MSVSLEPDLSSDDVFISLFPIHRACRDGDVGALVSLLQRFSNQSHLTVEDSYYGLTPIHWAAHHGQLECVMRLVQTGCEVNTATSRFKQTPTHTAAFGGHSRCVEWLTQAGADINRQDFLGEAPIHKAARSGSLECIQVLLIAGAKPSLRNVSGQTALDLAEAQGFHDCVCLISKTQLRGFPLNGVANGNSAPCGRDLHSRKRLLTAMDAGNMKKARRADDVVTQTLNSDDVESMIIESTQELRSDNTKATTNGLYHTLPYTDQDDLPESPPSLFSSPATWQEPEAPSQDSFADMCGSLHLTGSPSSCMSYRPSWQGLTGVDCGEALHYGHYHGFGDTAEELSDSSSSSIQLGSRHKQAAASTIHLYHGS